MVDRPVAENFQLSGGCSIRSLSVKRPYIGHAHPVRKGRGANAKADNLIHGREGGQLLGMPECQWSTPTRLLLTQAPPPLTCADHWSNPEPSRSTRKGFARCATAAAAPLR